MSILFFRTDIGVTLQSDSITLSLSKGRMEKRIKYLVGADKTCCINTQTACAEMALRLLGIGEGDEVIVPAYTYTAKPQRHCSLL